jgi:hypothetical protein
MRPPANRPFLQAEMNILDKITLRLGTKLGIDVKLFHYMGMLVSMAMAYEVTQFFKNSSRHGKDLLVDVNDIVTTASRKAFLEIKDQLINNPKTYAECGIDSYYREEIKPFFSNVILNQIKTIITGTIKPYRKVLPQAISHYLKPIQLGPYKAKKTRYDDARVTFCESVDHLVPKQLRNIPGLSHTAEMLCRDESTSSCARVEQQINLAVANGVETIISETTRSINHTWKKVGSDAFYHTHSFIEYGILALVMILMFAFLNRVFVKPVRNMFTKKKVSRAKVRSLS